MGASFIPSILPGFHKRAAPPSLDVVVAGYLGVDLTPRFPADRRAASLGELFRPGTLIQTRGLNISLGGAVANTGFALMKFGRRVEFMGCVGHDTLGDMVRALLSARGVQGRIRGHNKAGTAYGVVLAPPGADRLFLEDPGCNATFGAADIDFNVVRRSRLFHFGYPPLMQRLWRNEGAELKKMLARIRSLGVTTSVDMALPDADSPAGKADWRAILREILPHVDIFVPSLEEIMFMLDPACYARIRRSLDGGDIIEAIPSETIFRLGNTILQMGVKVAMIKASHRGAYIFTREVTGLDTSLAIKLPVANWSHRCFRAYPCSTDRRRMRNANGAGDCAVAGFLAALLSGKEIERAAQYAMRAGRDNLYGIDACSSLSDWTSMTRQIERTRLPKYPPLS
jgi:sugar/nucleoside kinase (ribokinase family)